jgi:ornithine carbamoyltransferase
VTRHFLEIDDLTPPELAAVLAVAERPPAPALAGRGVALVMGLPSARTRNSTEMAVVDLGGHPVTMGAAELGVDTRESAEDLARTLAQYHRVICARVPDHQVLVRMAGAVDAGHFDVPIVNLLSSDAHPVQALADLLTLRDVLGGGGPEALQGVTVAWIGDANNVARSFCLAAVASGLCVQVGAPDGYGFTEADRVRIAQFGTAAGLGGELLEFASASDAVAGARAVCTDVWISMGQEGERAERLSAFAQFQVNEVLMGKAAPDAVVLHCLPAHRGEEIDDVVLDGPRSRVWQQAAHRRTAMRGLLTWLVEVQR